MRALIVLSSAKPEASQNDSVHGQVDAIVSS